ncbi:MAG: hypothetical protein J6Y33_03130 [Prevotella sp.]|nr:hypothetical protein [Prevotella sp.]
MAEGMGISPEIVASIIRRYMQVVVRNVQRGHRVKLADVLTIYPQISCSVKDEVDDQGNIVKVVTADMLNVATIAQGVQQSFAASVSWKRVSEKDADEDSTDPTTDPDNPGGTDDSGSGGSDQPQGGGSNTPSGGGGDDYDPNGDDGLDKD